MARYLDILVSYKYYFINLPQKKKEKSFGRQNGQVNIKELSLLPQDINT